MRENEECNVALKVICDFIPSLSKLFNDDECIAVSDREKFIDVIVGSKFSMPYKVGDKLGPTLLSTIESGKTSIYDIPEDIVPGGVKCYCMPIHYDGDVVGLLSVTNHLENKNKLREIIKELTESLRYHETTYI